MITRIYELFCVDFDEDLKFFIDHLKKSIKCYVIRTRKFKNKNKNSKISAKRIIFTNCTNYIYNYLIKTSHVHKLQIVTLREEKPNDAAHTSMIQWIGALNKRFKVLKLVIVNLLRKFIQIGNV